MPGGQQISVQQGSLGSPGQAALSGQQISAGQGSVLWHPNETSSLIGQPITTGQGTLAFRSQRGQQINTSQGTLGVANPQPALVGLQVISGQGTLTPSGNNVTVNITGEEFTGLTGITAIGPVLLTGVEGDFFAGLLGNSRTCTFLSGVDEFNNLLAPPIFMLPGTLVPGIEADDAFIQARDGLVSGMQAVALVGSAVTSQTGSVSTFNKEEQLAGQPSVFATGTASPSATTDLQGISLSVLQQSVGAPGIASLIGQQISSSPGFMESAGAEKSRALVGQVVVVPQGRLFAVVPAGQGGATRRQHMRFRRDVDKVASGSSARSTVARPEFLVETAALELTGLQYKPLGELGAPLLGEEVSARQRSILGKQPKNAAIEAALPQLVGQAKNRRQLELEAMASNLLPSTGVRRAPPTRRAPAPQVAPPPKRQPGERKTTRELEARVAQLQRGRNRRGK